MSPTLGCTSPQEENSGVLVGDYSGKPTDARACMRSGMQVLENPLGAWARRCSSMQVLGNSLGARARRCLGIRLMLERTDARESTRCLGKDRRLTCKCLGMQVLGNPLGDRARRCSGIRPMLGHAGAWEFARCSGAQVLGRAGARVCKCSDKEH